MKGNVVVAELTYLISFNTTVTAVTLELLRSTVVLQENEAIS